MIPHHEVTPDILQVLNEKLDLFAAEYFGYFNSRK